MENILRKKHTLLNRGEIMVQNQTDFTASIVNLMVAVTAVIIVVILIRFVIRGVTTRRPRISIIRRAKGVLGRVR